jgi:hypothetical protein
LGVDVWRKPGESRHFGRQEKAGSPPACGRVGLPALPALCCSRLHLVLQVLPAAQHPCQHSGTAIH